jgi:uncharacterized protein (TIGR02246 family)
MDPANIDSLPTPDAREQEVRNLYDELLGAWNRREPEKYAALFAAEANVVGFDGSAMRGPQEIEEHLAQIFADHQTGKYVAVVREVRFVQPDVALLTAVSGLVLHGQSDLNEAANALHTLLAVWRDGWWQIELFQNTPAQYHGRPEAREALSEELRQQL